MSVRVPFTVLIDSAETLPFRFEGLRGDADVQGRELLVPTKRRALGRHPDSLGDYSVAGFVGEVGVERKSVDDLIGTLLGWEREFERRGQTVQDRGRRARFERELANLSGFCSLVVVEGSLQTVLDSCYETPNKSQAINAKIVNRSVLAYMQDYSVSWIFCDSRRLAEVETFRWLYRFHEKHGRDRRG